MTKTKKVSENGRPEVLPTGVHTLTLSDSEAGLIYQVCREGVFPTPEAKMAAASIQAKLEALVSQQEA